MSIILTTRTKYDGKFIRNHNIIFLCTFMHIAIQSESWLLNHHKNHPYNIFFFLYFFFRCVPLALSTYTDTNTFIWYFWSINWLYFILLCELCMYMYVKCTIKMVTALFLYIGNFCTVLFVLLFYYYCCYYY